MRSTLISGFRPWLRLAVVTVAALCSSTPGALAEYREVEVKDGGTIRGKVTFTGSVPESAVEHFPIPGKWPGCGRGFRDVTHIQVKDGALAGVFVLIDGLKKGKKWPPSNGEAVLDQKKCHFEPTRQIVRRGSTMIVRNSDDGVLHNVNMRELIELKSGRSVQLMMFNLAQPVVVELRKKIDPRESPFLEVGCELHNFMIAQVLAPEHPYAALVGDDGSFELDDVPPGEHTLVAWHPKLGKRKLSAAVPARGTVEVSFAFAAHPDQGAAQR